MSGMKYLKSWTAVQHGWHSGYASSLWIGTCADSVRILFVLVALLSFSQATAQELCFQGTAKMRMYILGRTQEQATAFFSIKIRDCRWFVRFVRDEGENAFDYEEISHDGTNVYHVVCLERLVERERAKGKKMAPNTAYAEVFRGEVYNKREADEVGPIWLTYASGCYFQGRTNDAVEPGMAFDGFGVRYGPPAHHKLRAHWTLSDSNPAFPIRVIYFHDPELDENRQRVKLTAPWDTRFTKAIFETEAFTNLGGLKVPLASSLKIFTAKTNAVTSTDLDLLVEYRVRLTNVLAVTGTTGFEPSIPRVAVTKDMRFGQLAYYSTNQFPTDQEVLRSEYFEQVRELNSRPNNLAPRKRSLIAAAFVFLFLAPIVAYLGRKCFSTTGKSA